MTKYLFQANYVGQGIAGLMQEGGSQRREALARAVESLGGSLESIYYAFGETNVLGVLDIPDQASALALSFMMNSTGTVDGHLTPLMTPEDVDAAVGKIPAYRAPGQ